MDSRLVYLLIVCVLWAGLLLYVFVLRREPDPGSGGKSGLVVLTAVMIPLLGLALCQQSRSGDRLERLGFAIFPGLRSSVGVATGSSQQGTWLYSLKESAAAALEFYRDPANHRGWKLSSSGADSLIFERGSSKLQLRVSNGHAAFLLFDADAAKPDARGK